MGAGVTIAEIEREIEALGYGSQAYHEAMAFYLLTMARAQWRLADRAGHHGRLIGRATGIADPIEDLR
jgi:hypothetical protein